MCQEGRRVSALNRVKWVVVCVAIFAANAAAQSLGPAPSVGSGGAPLAAGTHPAVERQALGSAVRARQDAESAVDGTIERSNTTEGETGIAGSAIAAAGVSGLIVVIGLVVRMAMRKQGGLMAAIGAGGRAPSGLVEVLARYPLGRQSTLIVLKIDRRVLLLNQVAGRGGGMTVLSEFTDAEEVASILLRTRDETETRAAARFQDMLAGASEPYAMGQGGSGPGMGSGGGGGALNSLRRHLNLVTGSAAKGAA